MVAWGGRMRLQPLSHAMQEDPQGNLGQSLTEDCKLLSIVAIYIWPLCEREAEDPHSTPAQHQPGVNVSQGLNLHKVPQFQVFQM